MANAIHLFLESQPNTLIKGSSDRVGRKDSIEVIAHDHTLLSPTDDNTGNWTGPHKHSPFRFTKALDSATTPLIRALTNKEVLSSAEFKFYRSSSGYEEMYYVVRLENVRVVKVSSKMYDMKDPAFEKYDYMEMVELRYEKIIWTYVDGQLTHSDSWDERQVG